MSAPFSLMSTPKFSPTALPYSKLAFPFPASEDAHCVLVSVLLCPSLHTAGTAPPAPCYWLRL